MSTGKCFVCEEENLDWQCHQGKWLLFDSTGDHRHQCPPGAREKFNQRQEEIKKENRHAVIIHRERNGYL